MKNTPIRLTHLATAKAEIYEALRDWKPGDLPIVVIWTERRIVSYFAYGVANTFPERRSFWASGENSRYDETMQIFERRWTDGNVRSVFDAACAFTLSPVAPSGVSFDEPVGKVFLLHRKRNFPIESCIQLVRRFRNPESVVFGIANFTPVYVAYDDETLDAICAGLNDVTTKLLFPKTPTMRGETTLVPVDPEFALSWRIQARRLLRSYEDPIGRLRELAQEYKIDLQDDLAIPKRDKSPEFRAFGNIIDNGERWRRSLESFEVNRAQRPDDREAKRIKEQARYHKNERQKRLRYDLEQFYGEDISVELVEKDNGGTLRRKCLAYLDFEMVNDDQDLEAHEDSPFAWMCWEENRGRQPVSWTHKYQRAYLLLTAFVCMAGRRPSAEDHQDPQWRSSESIRVGILDFMERFGDTFAINFPRNKLTHPDKAVRFANGLIRGLGFEIEKRGRIEREYRWSCATIRDLTRYQKKKRIERFEEAKKKKNWKDFISHVRKT